MSKIDFVAAASRHWRDAAHLLAVKRLDNALYLAGYVAECSLKAVVERSGITSPATFGHRLVRLEGEGLDLAMAMSPATARYRPPVGAVSIVSDSWSPSCRYGSSNVSYGTAQRILEQAESIFKSCIGEMLLDGVLGEFP